MKQLNIISRINLVFSFSSIDQNNGFNIEKRQGLRVRPYITNRVCPYRMRNSPLCCAGMLIDKPLVKTCCRGVIVLKGQCGRRMSKCGRTLFNRRYEKCCRRQVIPRRESCTRKRCGRTRYMTFSHQCCNGKVIPKGQTCVPFPVKTRCGGVPFNPHRYKCCFKRVVPLHSPCSSWTVKTRCGSVPFNPHRYKCCFKRVVPLHSPCSSWTPCGHTFYDSQHQQCCNGQVLSLRSGFKCCHGNQIVPNFVRCNAYG